VPSGSNTIDVDFDEPFWIKRHADGGSISLERKMAFDGLCDRARMSRFRAKLQSPTTAERLMQGRETVFDEASSDLNIERAMRDAREVRKRLRDARPAPSALPRTFSGRSMNEREDF
jgi:hypothetical protein